MGRPVLRLATRISRRTRWTAWAIAFACMVLVGSLSLADGLGAGVDAVTARFSSGATVYLRGSDLLGSAIDASALAAIPTDYAVLRAHLGALSINGLSRTAVVASWTVYHGGNATVPFPAASLDVAIDSGLRSQIENASGHPLGTTANVSLFGLASKPLAVTAAPASRPSMLPDTWAWVRPDLFLSLSASEGGPAQAVITPVPLDAGMATWLGLTPLQTVGAIGFTEASIAEAQSVLLGLAGVLAVVIGLLAYNAIGLEVHLRQDEIRTLCSLGASPRTIAAVYEAKALVIALLGATVGSALGIVVAHGIVSFAPLLGLPNLLLLPLPVVPVALAYGLAVGAAALGGLLPAAHAVRLLRRPTGARPS
ncbi:MAG TPA: ABC transporter permease [Thermoplasmata archaeon]|nr:ABC transporter permease [Thermoplasmata archaeon]